MAAHRARLAHYVGGMGTRRVNFYNRLTARYGFPEEADRVRDLYLSRDRDAAMRALPTDLVDHTCLIGDAHTVATRLAAYRAAGVTVLNVAPHGTSLSDKLQHLSRLQELQGRARS